MGAEQNETDDRRKFMHEATQLAIESVEKLVAQMDDDVDRARELLGGAS